MISLRKRSARLAISAALLGSGLGVLSLASGPAAHADPSYTSSASPYVCVGSDTLQDLFNAFTGQEPSAGALPPGLPALASAYYTPLHATASAGNAKFADIQSFDALDPHVQAPAAGANTQTITTKLGGVTFDRPNGSGDGRAALEAGITGGNFARSADPGTPEPTHGQVDCARSSSASGTAQNTVDTTANTMSGIPIASDAVSYFYHCANPGTADCTALRTLPAAVWQTAYGVGAAGSGSGIINAGTNGWTGTNTLAVCAINTGSGTFGTFLKAVAKISGQAAISTTVAKQNLQQVNGSNCVDVEENNGSTFLSSGPNGALTGAANDDWVIPASFGNVKAQHDSFALNRSGQPAPNLMFNAGGAFTTGDGMAGVADAWTTSLTTAISAPTNTITIKLKPAVTQVLTIDPGLGTQESVTVQSVGAPSGGVYTVTLTANTTQTHLLNAVVQDLTVGQGLEANTTVNPWTIDTAYEGSQLGRWLFVYVNSAAITAGFTHNQGIDDMFFSPLATGGTAQVCLSPYKDNVTKFGFDNTLPDNGISGEQAGTCGNVAFSKASS